MRRRLLIFFFVVWNLLGLTSPILAAESYLEEDFSNLDNIDMGITTANVDLDKNYVELPLKSVNNALALYRDNYDITLVNGNFVETYRYNGSNMVVDEGLSTEFGLSNPISVSARGYGEYAVLDAETGKMIYFNNDGSDMVANPFFALSGFTNPISVSVQEDSLDLAVLDNGDVKWYSFDGNGLVINGMMSRSTGVHDPVSLSVKSNSFDYAVVSRNSNEVKYFSWDGGSIVNNPHMSLTGADSLTKPQSISIHPDENMYLVADYDGVKAFNFDGSNMIHNPILSRTSGLNNIVSVAIRPGSYDYAVMDVDENRNPTVKYFAFDGSGMTEIVDLRITGLEKIGYTTVPKVLQSKIINAGIDVVGLRIDADVELPEGTNIVWEVSVDGGGLWKTATLGGEKVIFETPGSQVIYRATLSTTDPEVTPRIINVRLIDASLGIGTFVITEVVGPPLDGNPDFPSVLNVGDTINIWAGYKVRFSIDTYGFAERVTAVIEVLDGEIIELDSNSGSFEPVNSISENFNTWESSFYTDIDVPIGTLLNITFEAHQGFDTESVSYPGFAKVAGSAMANHPLHLTR